MPQNIFELPPRLDTTDPIDRKEEKLISIIPKDKKRYYEMREIIDSVFDEKSVYIATHFLMNV